MASTTPTTILEIDQDHCLATWDRTFVQIWRLASSADAAQRMRTAISKFGGSQPGKITILFIVEPSSVMPDAAARKVLVDFFDDIAAYTSSLAIVAEGGGFRSATVRSIGIAVGGLVRRPFAVKVVATLDEGIEVLAPHLAETASGAADLHDAVTRLRAQMANHA